MNRRSFFKVLTGYVAGVYAAFVPKAMGSKQSYTYKEIIDKDIEGELQKRSGTRLVTKGEIPVMTIDTSSNNVIYEVKLTYWDKDEPDIYTVKDGVLIN